MKYSQSALIFNGVSQYVNFGDTYEIDFDQTWTVIIWAKVSKTTFADSCFLSKQESAMNKSGWRFGFNNSDQTIGFELISATGNGIIVKTIETFEPDDQWHMFSVTIDGTSSASGVAIAIDAVDRPLTIVQDNLSQTIETDANFCAGSRNGTELFHKGSLDEPVLFSNVLSSANLQQLFNNGQPTNAESVGTAVGWWRFGDSTITDRSGSTTEDVSSGGNNNNGTLVNFDLESGRDTATAQYIRRKYSMKFEGAQSLNCGVAANFERFDSFSVALAFKTDSSSNAVIVSNQGQVPEGYRGWAFILVGANGKLLFQLAHDVYAAQSDRIDVQTTDGNFNDGEWHFAVVTYDGSGVAAGVTITVDDVDQVNDVVFDQLTDTIVRDPLGDLHVGSRDNVEAFTNALLMNVLVTDIELTQVQKKALLNFRELRSFREFGPPLANQVVYLPLAEWETVGESGGISIDRSDSGNDATQIGLSPSSKVLDVINSDT